MGGVGAYCGSCVCQIPIARAAHVAVQARSDGQFRLRMYDRRTGNHATVSWSRQDLYQDAQLRPTGEFMDRLGADWDPSARRVAGGCRPG